MKKEYYENLELEVIEFSEEDIIIMSVTGCDTESVCTADCRSYGDIVLPEI